MANYSSCRITGALPGILTGFILSLSRALGETPLILIGIPTILLATPTSIMSMFTDYQLKFTLGLKCLKNSKMLHQNYYITCNLITNERSSHFLT